MYACIHEFYNSLLSVVKSLRGRALVWFPWYITLVYCQYLGPPGFVPQIPIKIGSKFKMNIKLNSLTLVLKSRHKKSNSALCPAVQIVLRKMQRFFFTSTPLIIMSLLLSYQPIFFVPSLLESNTPNHFRRPYN